MEKRENSSSQSLIKFLHIFLISNNELDKLNTEIYDNVGIVYNQDLSGVQPYP